MAHPVQFQIHISTHITIGQNYSNNYIWVLVTWFFYTLFSKFSAISWKGFKNRRKWRKVMGPPCRINCCFYFRYLMKEGNVLEEVWDHYDSSPRSSLPGYTSIWSVFVYFSVYYVFQKHCTMVFFVRFKTDIHFTTLIKFPIPFSH